MEVANDKALESVGYDNLFGDIISLDADLSTKERNKLPDIAFGLPKLRKYPLKILKDGELEYDERHIRQAIAYFGKCEDQYKDELAKNIVTAIKVTKMSIKISEGSAFYPYYKKYYK